LSTYRIKKDVRLFEIQWPLGEYNNDRESWTSWASIAVMFVIYFSKLILLIFEYLLQETWG
jgi:hypothetical protein